MSLSSSGQDAALSRRKSRVRFPLAIRSRSSADESDGLRDRRPQVRVLPRTPINGV